MKTQEIKQLMQDILGYAKQGKEITSNADLCNKYMKSRYIVSVTQFGNEELYSFRDWEDADYFVDSFDVEDKDIKVKTYDLGIIGFDSNNDMFFESIY